MIDEFISQFTEKKIEYIKKGEEYFLQNPFLQHITSTIPFKPSRIGLFLGREKRKNFVPSLALLGLISPFSTKKVFLNEKQEWLFVCKRDIFLKEEPAAYEGHVLMQNANDENLGLGKIDKKRRLIINILDRGDFLRRERNHGP